MLEPAQPVGSLCTERILCDWVMNPLLLAIDDAEVYEIPSVISCGKIFWGVTQQSSVLPPTTMVKSKVKGQ